MIFFIIIISYILIFYKNFELIFHLITFEWKKNRKKLTLCQNNKNKFKFCNFWINIIADMFSNMSRSDR